MRGCASRCGTSRVLLVTIIEKQVPFVPEHEMCKIEDLGHGLWAVTASVWLHAAS